MQMHSLQYLSYYVKINMLILLITLEVQIKLFSKTLEQEMKNLRTNYFYFALLNGINHVL